MWHNPDDVVHVRRSRLAATAAFLVIAAVGRSTLAGNSSWNALDGNFNTAGNWTNGVPGSGDTAVFRRGTEVSYTVTFPEFLGSPVDYVTDHLRVGSNMVSFAEFRNGTSTYTLNSMGISETNRGIIIGETSSDTSAVLTTRLTAFSAVAATIGDATGSNGTLNISAGTFNTTNPFPLVADNYIGYQSGSVGLVNVNGASSKWNSKDLALFVGKLGAGTLNITNGGAVSVFRGP